MACSLQRLIVGDEPASWSEAGFEVRGNSVALGKVVVELVGAAGPRGILGWALDGVGSEIDGLSTVIVPDHVRPAPQQHPNMVFAIDHVVVTTKNTTRAVLAFEAAGMEERKVRTFTSAAGAEMQQSFFWAGRVIVELVGPVVADPDDGVSKFWGLALVSSDLESTAELLGERLSEPKDAVQPGRKIATLHTREFGISVPIAVMSPHVANLGDIADE